MWHGQIKNWPYIAEFVGGVSAEAAAAVTEAKEGLAKAQTALEEAKAQSDKSHTAHDAAVAAKEEADTKKTQAEEEDALSKKAHDELVAAQEEAQKVSIVTAVSSVPRTSLSISSVSACASPPGALIS